MSDSVRPLRWQPARLPCPWDSPGKNTGVGCHFLLQCMKVKSESEVAQSCPTRSDPMDCSPPGSSVHGIFQARVLEWGAIAFYSPNTGILLFMIYPPSGMSFLKKFQLTLFFHTSYAVAINLAFYTVHLVFEKERSINPFRRNHGMENR